MSCCGKKRAQLLQTTQTSHVPEPGEQTSMQSQPELDTLAYFQYIGRTGLTVVGRETRKRYRFDKPGAIVAVDIRDHLGLSTVPILRRVKVQKK
jgi:hypothetical protein